MLSLAWDFLEGLGLGIHRNDISSWSTPKWPDPFGNGILCGDGVGQSELMWYARSLPPIRTIFSKIWGTSELATSFDGCCFWRAFEYQSAWKTHSARAYHLDQNGVTKPSKCCVQGFLNVLPAGPGDGGLVIVPRSHTTVYPQIFKNFKGRSDWIPLHNHRPLWEEMIPQAGLAPIKVCAEAGDFVVWDSRIIHCNGAGHVPREVPADQVLPPRRLVTYVCMTPKSRLRGEVVEERRRCYLNGDTTNHWPEDFVVGAARKNNNKDYKPIQLSQYCADLIPL
uniref:Phytanoyl-CoA dioxygenase n=1 Tax=Arcella intermedia TaxID=1963864 RepID=A0A6B2LB10_9EUKA